MSSKHFRKLSIHVSQYFVAQALAMAGGLLTFPLLTRLLSKSDYGLINLINAAIGICVIASKCGMQNATVRFLPSAQKDGDISEPLVYSTVVFTTFFLACVLSGVFFLVAKYIFAQEIKSDSYILILASLIVIERVLYLTFTTFFRANQKALQVSILQVANKYLLIIFLFLFFFYYKASAFVLYNITFFSEVIILLICIYWFYIYKRNFFINGYSTQFLKKSLAFGLPLLGFELVTEFLTYGDRYLIYYFCNTEAVAIYSAGYNLADYMRGLLLYPIAFAATPIITDMWENKGRIATEKFVSDTLEKYWFFLIPAIVGISFVGGDLIVFLASAKYVDSYFIIPYVILGTTLYGTYPLTGAGLFLANRTAILFYLVVVAVAINFILNCFLIPLEGIVGAAQATLISYIFLFLSIIKLSRKYLIVNIFSKSLFVATVSSVFMLICLTFLRIIILGDMQNGPVRIFYYIITGSFTYASMLFVLDTKFRSWMKALFIKLNDHYLKNK